MNGDRADLIKQLFRTAIELVGPERERFLAARCGGDSALRTEVDELLRADDRVHSRFLEGPMRSSTEITMPERIGRFRLLRKIGEGGMGSVFEAEQDHPRRRVALKIIRSLFLTESLLRRFELEVEILGHLNHPAIARVYEAGTHQDGSRAVPYFAMEYIHGRPLVEFSQHHGLTVRQRLELMAEICDAVHHAHQKGVIHRDLKPANVLVEEPPPSPSLTKGGIGGGGHPKILDFGVARATHSDMQLVTMHTEVGQLVGTLSYMSPEQVTGRPDEVDTRSDVYSLGVILFEMLGGRLPYDLKDHSISEAGGAIREREPFRLSSIDSAFRGDIETIVAKALAKEKDRRYQSASEFAADIRRFLRDDPIVARRATRAYQLRKFAKRNKAIVGAVASVLVVLVLGIIGTGVALLRATKAERVALQRSEESRRSAAKATAVNAFLQEMLASVDPATALGKEVTIRQALDEAAARIGSGSLKDEPGLEAELRSTIGMTYLALGHYVEAEPHLCAAVDICRKVHGDTPQDLAGTLDNLASLRGAQGRYADAASLLGEAMLIHRRLHGDKHVNVAATMQSLGAALRNLHRYDEAERYYRSALTMRRELLGSEHIEVAQSVNSLALVLQNKGDFAGAEPPFREALAMRRKLLGEPHPVVADALNNLANLLNLRGNASEAERLLREALEMRRELLGAEHPGVAQSLNNLAVLRYDQGDFLGAEPLFREALAIWRRTLPEGHSDIGSVTAGLGLALLAKGAFAEAEPLLRESLAIREATLPEAHWQRFGSMSALGAALAGQGKFAEAEPFLLRGYEGLIDRPEVAQQRKQQAVQRIIDLYESWNRPEIASRWRAEPPTPNRPK